MPLQTGFFTITEALRFIAKVLDVSPALLDGKEGAAVTRLIREAAEGRTREGLISRVHEGLATAIGMGLQADDEDARPGPSDRDTLLLSSLLESIAVYWTLHNVVRLPPSLDRREVVRILARHEFVPRLAVTLSEAASAYFAGALQTPLPRWMGYPARAPRGMRRPLDRVFHRLRELVGASQWAPFCYAISKDRRDLWPGLEQLKDWRHARHLPSREICGLLASQIEPYARNGFPEPDDVRSPAAFESARRYLRRDRRESDSAVATALQVSGDTIRSVRAHGEPAGLSEEDRHLVVRRVVHRWGLLSEGEIRGELLSAVYAERLIAAAVGALGGPTTTELAQLFANVYNTYQGVFEAFRIACRAKGVTGFDAQCALFREMGPQAFRLTLTHPEGPLFVAAKPSSWAILGILLPPDDLLAGVIETEAWTGRPRPAPELFDALNHAWRASAPGAGLDGAEEALAHVQTDPIFAEAEADSVAFIQARLAVKRGHASVAIASYEHALTLTAGRGGPLSSGSTVRRVERIGEEYLGLLGFLITEHGEHRKREYSDLHRRLVLLNAVAPFESAADAIATSSDNHRKLWERKI